MQEQTQVNKLKYLCLNSLEKLGNVRKSNSKTLKFQWRDIISDYEFLLSFLSAFTDGTEQYYPNCYHVNDVKGLQILYHDCTIILRLEVTN